METVIDLDIPPHESVLVLNGILHTDTNVQVVVSNSVGAFSNNSPSFINRKARSRSSIHARRNKPFTKLVD